MLTLDLALKPQPLKLGWNFYYHNKCRFSLKCIYYTFCFEGELFPDKWIILKDNYSQAILSALFWSTIISNTCFVLKDNYYLINESFWSTIITKLCFVLKDNEYQSIHVLFWRTINSSLYFLKVNYFLIGKLIFIKESRNQVQECPLLASRRRKKPLLDIPLGLRSHSLDDRKGKKEEVKLNGKDVFVGYFEFSF